MSVFFPQDLIQPGQLTFPAATLKHAQPLKVAGACGWEQGWQWQYVGVVVLCQTVPVKGQVRAESFVLSPSGSWELRRFLLLTDKSQEISLPWEVGC